MSSDLVKFELELRLLSPVHIGMGEKYSKLDFVFDPQKKQAGLLSERNWLAWLVKNGLMESYTQAVQRSGMHMDNYLFLTQQGIRDPLHQCLDIYSTILEIEQDVNSLNEISRQLKDVYQQPYIPGSSIKGAFRTGIMVALIRDAYKQGSSNAEMINQIWSELEAFIHNPQIYRRREMEMESKRILQKLDAVFFKPVMTVSGKALDRQLSDPFRGLLIGDSKPFSKESTIIAKKHDLVVPSGRNAVSEIALWRESIRPGSTTRFPVLLNRAHLHETGLDLLTDASSLLQCLREHRQIVLDRHEKLLTNKIKESPMIDAYNLHVTPPMEGYVTFTLGGGTGFQCKSLIYSLAPDAEAANRLVEVLLEKQFPRKHKGRDSIAAPRTIKTTFLRTRSGVLTPGRYKLGICAVREV